MELQDLERTQMLFDTTPKDKTFVFRKPSLWLLSGEQVVWRWENTQPFYFYPFSVLDFLSASPRRSELRVINSGVRTSRKAIRESRGSKVHFEEVNLELMDYALSQGCKVSAICDIKQIAEADREILSRLDMLTVRVSPEDDLSVLDGIPNKRLLSGIRVYISEESNNFKRLAERARLVGLDFIHVSKRLVGTKQVYLDKKYGESIRDLMKLETESFKVLLPRNTTMVYNEKFEISDRFGNCRSCAFSRHRTVLFKDRFYPCYTKSIINSGMFSFRSAGAMHSHSELFGKTCSDCACIYENDLFEDIHRRSKGLRDRMFLLGFSHVNYTRLEAMGFPSR